MSLFPCFRVLSSKNTRMFGFFVAARRRPSTVSCDRIRSEVMNWPCSSMQRIISWSNWEWRNRPQCWFPMENICPAANHKCSALRELELLEHLILRLVGVYTRGKTTTSLAVFFLDSCRYSDVKLDLLSVSAWISLDNRLPIIRWVNPQDPPNSSGKFQHLSLDTWPDMGGSGCLCRSFSIFSRLPIFSMTTDLESCSPLISTTLATK